MRQPTWRELFKRLLATAVAVAKSLPSVAAESILEATEDLEEEEDTVREERVDYTDLDDGWNSSSGDESDREDQTRHDARIRAERVMILHSLTGMPVEECEMVQDFSDRDSLIYRMAKLQETARA